MHMQQPNNTSKLEKKEEKQLSCKEVRATQNCESSYKFTTQLELKS